MSASGNEKPVVENRVKTMQRRSGTPVPTTKNMVELNASLRQCCGNDRSRPVTAAGVNATTRETMTSEETIAETSAPAKLTISAVLKLDIRQFAALPRHPFKACERSTVTVDKYQMVRFDKVGYSRTTQDWLPAAGQALPDGLSTRRTPTKGFQFANLHLFLLSQATWRNPTHRGCYNLI